MKKVLKKFNRALSIMLAAAMVLTMVPQTAMPVLAASEKPAVELEDVGETGESPTDGQKEDVADPSTEVSDEGDSDKKGDDITNEDPSDEDPDTEEPSEGDVEDNETPADEADAEDGDSKKVENTLMSDEIQPQADTSKLYPSIDNSQKDKWTLTKVEGLSGDGKTYITVDTMGSGESAWDGFVDVSENGIAATDLTGKILAFGVDVKDGYQFKSDNKNEQVKASLLTGENGTLIEEIKATYETNHYEIDLGQITSEKLGENEWPNLKVWADVVKTYTVTMPTGANATVAIESGAPDGKTDASADIVFTVAANDGYILKAVKYAVGDGDPETLTAVDGKYTIPKAKITDNITISVETAEKITISFDGYTGMTTNYYEIYSVTKKDDGTYEAAETAMTTSLDAVEGEDTYFLVKANEMFNVRSVSAKDAAGKKLNVSKMGTTDDGNIYRLRSDSNATVTVELALNNSKAYKATFEIAEGSDPYFTVTANGTALDTSVRNRNVYTAKNNIDLTVTPDTGYEITQIKKQSATSWEDVTLNGTGAQTISAAFTEDANTAVYRVTVSAKALTEDGGKVTFTMTDADDLTLEVVTAEGKVEEVENEEGAYQIKSGAKYLEFTLTTENTKIVPAVKVGEKTWGSTTEKSPFTYKVSAGLLTNDTTIAITQETAEKELKIVADGNHIDLDAITVQNKETKANYSGTEYADDDESGMLYYIPVDTELALTISAKQSCVIKSYQIDSAKAVNVNASSAEISVKIEEDTKISVVSESQQTAVLENEAGEAVEKGKDGYAVNYNAKYAAYILNGAEGKLALEKATLEGTNLATAQPVLNNDAAEFTVAAADAGKKLTLKLYDSAAANAKPVATYVLNVNKAITKVTVPGVKNKKLAQPVDTKLEYVVTAEPKGVDTTNLDVDVKWEGASETDKNAFTATMADGKLTITTPVAKDAAAVEALNAAAAKATIRFVDTTKGDTEAAIVAGSEFTLEITEPTALKNVTPTVTQKSSDDISFTLTLGVPASAKIVAPNAGMLWYEVTVTPQAGISTNSITKATTYYFPKEDAATQDAYIEIINTDFGSGYGKKFDVTAKLVQTIDQTTNLNTATADAKDAALTEFASKESKKLTASTKDPYFETKLSLKNGTTTVYTGQTDVKIATLVFGKNTTYIQNATAVDITPGLSDNDEDITELELEVRDGAVYLSIPFVDDDYAKVALGKHTIRVTAKGPNDTYPTYKDMVVTVNRGIEYLDLDAASDTIFREDGKKATLKVTPVYNQGNVKNVYEAKSKKVKDYVLVAAEESKPKTDEKGNDVILNVTGLSVKNGTITVDKSFDLAAAKAAGNDKFFVRATANDWNGNTTVGYSEQITVTAEKLMLGSVLIVKYDSTQNVYVPVINADKKSATLNDFGSYDEVDGVYDAFAVVLKSTVTPKASYDANDFVAPTYLTFKSSNAKSLGIDNEGNITAVKPGKNIKITVTTNDGGKQTAVLDKIEVANAKPAMLGLKVENVNNYGYATSYEELNGDYTDQNVTFTGTANSVLKLTVMRSEGDGWYSMDEFSDLKVTISKAKILNKVSSYNQEYTVIANTAQATVKLAYTDKEGAKVTKEYKINNNGINTAKAPSVKASGNLIAGYYDKAQEITYTLQGTYDYKGKVVMVKADAADRSNAKNTARYESLEDQGNINGWIPISEDGKFTLQFGKNYTDITAGNYKLNLTFGTLAADGSMLPDTKSATVTLKAVAPKVLKSSYKPVAKVKMSVYDTAAGVTLAGSGKNIEEDSESYENLLNANITGQANHFRDLFELNGNVLQLKLAFSDDLKAALKKAGEITEETDAAVVAYITAGTSKAAKNDRIGYVEYYACGVDGKEYSGTTKITVTFDNKKSADTYTLTNTTILEGTEGATVQVLKNKKAGAVIEDAYVLSSDKDGKFTVGSAAGDEIDLTLDKATAEKPNKYKVTIAVIPENNYYAVKLAELKAAWNDAQNAETPDEAATKAAEEAYVNFITEKGVKLTTTITVGAKDKTGNKISVAKNLLKQTFTGYYVGKDDVESGYDGKHQNYWIKVPYTKNMECDIASIDSSDTAYVKAEGEEGTRTNLISFNDESGCINIVLNKADLERAVAANKVKYNNKGIATLTVTATVHFGNKWVNDDNGGHWEVVGEDGKDIIKSETVKFTLTFPAKPTEASNYAKAVEAVQTGKEGIAKAAVPADWLWNGEGLPLPAVADDKITLTSDANEELIYRLNDLVCNVRDEITKIAPEDYDVMIVMPQECVKNDGVDTMTLSDGDFTAPTTSATGTFKVKAVLYNATTLDENGNVIEAAEGVTASEKTEVEIELTIPALKEKPADIETTLQSWINTKESDADYIKYLKDDGGVQVAKDARVALGITDADGNPKNSLRLYVDDWSYGKASTEEKGEINGTIKVFGYRYGGVEVEQSFRFEIPKLENLADTVTLVGNAVKDLTATNATVKADILKAANDAIRNPEFKAVWQKTDAEDKKDADGDNYKLVKADRTNAGSVTGVIVVDDGNAETTGNTVEVSLTIAKLPAVADAIANVKDAVAIGEDGVDADEMLKLIEIGENTSAKVKEVILAAANDAVKDDGFTVAYKKDGKNELFSFTPAKYDTKGSISFTLELTDTLAETPTAVEQTVAIAADAPFEFGPFTNLQTFDQAKNAVQKALDDFKASVTNDTDENAVKAAAQAVVTGNDLTVTVSEFEKTAATVKAAGNIKCKVIITNTAATKANTATVPFEATIAKLSQTLEEAKGKAQGVLDGMDALTNEAIETTGEGDDAVDSVKADVLSGIVTAVEAVVDTDAFKVAIDDAEGAVTAEKATTEKTGSIKITVKITEKKDTDAQSDTAVKTWTISPVEETPEG